VDGLGAVLVVDDLDDAASTQMRAEAGFPHVLAPVRAVHAHHEHVA
jgi:hypothetical protein